MQYDYHYECIASPMAALKSHILKNNLTFQTGQKIPYKIVLYGLI